MTGGILFGEHAVEEVLPPLLFCVTEANSFCAFTSHTKKVFCP